MPKKLLRGIQRCRMLVVIATEQATKSPHVGKEIKLYKRTHLGNMSIIPIDFGGVLSATWFPRIDGLPPGPKESAEALAATIPSANIMERIRESFDFTRRNRRLFLSSVASLILLLALFSLSLLASAHAVAKTLEAAKAIAEEEAAKGEADRQREATELARQEADRQKEAARIAAKEAERLGKIAATAEKAAETAKKDTEVARRLEEKAKRETDRQQAIAAERLEHNRHLLYASDVTLAQRAHEAGAMKRVHDLLNIHLPTPAQPKQLSPGTPTQADARDFAWYYLWRASYPESQMRRRQEPTESGPYLPVAFSPDGKTLASASRDTTVKLWEISAQQELASLKGHSDSVTCITFSRDGKTLASASKDGTVHLWIAATKEQVAAAQSKQ